ncbi:MAG: hypothetical protein ACOX7P_06785 [Oscillospiraceae bacterium]|jgi:hypothetical protein
MTVFCPNELSLALCSAAGGIAARGSSCDIALFPQDFFLKEPLVCRTALIPGNLPPEAGRLLRVSSAVSYGPGQRDTVTLSSYRLGAAVVSVQRELPLPGGGFLEPQDIVLHGSLPDADNLIFSVGALLVMGVKPERVSAFWC